MTMPYCCLASLVDSTHFYQYFSLDIVIKMTSTQHIRAIVAKIKLPKKPHNMVIFLSKVRRSYRELSSQADLVRDY